MDNVTKIINSHNKYLAWKKNQANQIFGTVETRTIVRLTINYNRRKSFRHRKNEKDPELFKYIWELKYKHTEYQIRWSIARKSNRYNPVTKYCNLCLLETLLLCNFSEKSRLVNKRLDIVSKCRHENKYMLKNYSELSNFNYMK